MQAAHRDDNELGAGGHLQRVQQELGEPADPQVRARAGRGVLDFRTGPGQAAQCEQERAQLLLDGPQRPQDGQPARAWLDHHRHQVPAERTIGDERPPPQALTQHADGHGGHRCRGDRTGPPGGLPDPVLDDDLLPGELPAAHARRAHGPVMPRALILQPGVDGAQGRQVLADLVEGGGLDGKQGGGAAALHPVQYPGRRALPDDDVQADAAQLGPMTGGERPKLHRGETAAVAGEIAKPAPAVRQRLTVAAAKPVRQGGCDPAPEPDQDGRATGQGARTGQRGDGLAALTKEGGQPAGYQEPLDGGRGRPQGREPPGRRPGLIHVGRGDVA